MLDLGSGGGIDVILSAKLVGRDGLRARPGRDARARSAERRAVRGPERPLPQGLIEAIPLPAASVDVVISNCVINLSTDKATVLTEIARVL